MDAPVQSTQCTYALLAIVAPDVGLIQGCLEVELPSQFKLQAALAGVSFALCWVEADFHAGLRISAHRGRHFKLIVDAVSA
jgi:hypothetical protein